MGELEIVEAIPLSREGDDLVIAEGITRVSDGLFVALGVEADDGMRVGTGLEGGDNVVGAGGGLEAQPVDIAGGVEVV